MYRPAQSGPPAWFVFIIGIALVMAGYYLWQGFRDYIYTQGLGIQEATQQAALIASATAERQAEIQQNLPTLRPTSTSLPPCQDFVVDVPNAIVRAGPSTNTDVLETWPRGTDVCVIAKEENSEFYLIDRNQLTNRLEIGYMHQDIIRPLNPTPTVTRTFTPPPTITPMPTSPTITPTPPSSITPSVIGVSL